MSAKILRAVIVATLLALTLSIGVPAPAVESPAMLAGPGSSTASG